jgi:hypothetical protein
VVRSEIRDPAEGPLEQVVSGQWSVVSTFRFTGHWLLATDHFRDAAPVLAQAGEFQVLWGEFADGSRSRLRLSK